MNKNKHKITLTPAQYKKFFKVPDGYFPAAEAQILHKIQTLEAAESGESVAGVPKKMFFIQPSGAEARLRQRILQSVQKSKPTHSQPTKTIALVKYSMIAACLAGLWVGLWWLFWNNDSNYSPVDMALVYETDSEAMLEYVAVDRSFDLNQCLMQTDSVEQVLAFAYEWQPPIENGMEDYLLLDDKNLEIDDYAE